MPPTPDPNPPISQRAARLTRLFHHRWTVPILAQLHKDHGARFVPLAYRLGASEGALRLALDDLIADGLVTPNPGYGHPLRPEYILTAEATDLAPLCQRVDDLLDKLHLREIALKKWSMPVLWAVGDGPTRFSAVTRTLSTITDRAAAIALKDLASLELIDRRIHDGFPPSALYLPTRIGNRITPLLADL